MVRHILMTPFVPKHVHDVYGDTIAYTSEETNVRSTGLRFALHEPGSGAWLEALIDVEQLDETETTMTRYRSSLTPPGPAPATMRERRQISQAWFDAIERIANRTVRDDVPPLEPWMEEQAPAVAQALVALGWQRFTDARPE